MTKEEKAKELFNKYYNYLKANLMYDEEAIEDAKVCALIAIEEIINLYAYDDVVLDWKYISNHWKYWQEVKQEIEKL